MHPFQKHYYDVVQRDLVLSENISGVSFLPVTKKIVLCLGGNSSEDSYVVSSIAALYIITGQKPYVTQQKFTDYKNRGSKEPVGAKVTLRGRQMYLFWFTLLFHVLPRVRQFDGLKLPRHNSTYSFVLKDLFAFEDLIPLFPYFEDINFLQCQFYFNTINKDEVTAFGHSLYFCFITEGFDR